MRHSTAPLFADGEDVGTVGYHEIVEASGLAASHIHPGYLYTHNDHGDGAHIYVINTSGHHEATITLHGVTSHDWEDIAVGKCANGSNYYCIYIGTYLTFTLSFTNLVY